jgi:hypothetical protein
VTPEARERDDARYLVIEGRRWRRTAPGIPEPLRRELVRRLMHGRRAVAAALRAGDEDAERAARAEVHDAKFALGERGAAWWDEQDQTALETRAGAVIRTLLRERATGGVNPTEVARVLGMPRRVALVRDVMRGLADEKQLAISQRGRRTTAYAISGPEVASKGEQS